MKNNKLSTIRVDSFFIGRRRPSTRRGGRKEDTAWHLLIRGWRSRQPAAIFLNRMHTHTRAHTIYNLVLHTSKKKKFALNFDLKME